MSNVAEAHRGAGTARPVPEPAALDDKQAGHLRRIVDLSERLPDDWSGMLGRSTMQEDFGALRFQLAYMAYALALTHLHRLPAAPALFRKPFDSLIQKILSIDVWMYWHYVSTGNVRLNKGELPARWDPVAEDNIMYSAYVQSMALMYHYLFDDPKYARKGALSFKLQPLFWGSGDRIFAYDEKSLSQHLYWMMVEKGYLGIACEPNCVFQICNQPAILGFRLHDLVYGGDLAGEVTEGYRKAWAEFGIRSPDGHFNILALEREHALVQRPPAPWADFWLGALMHAWDPEGVEAAYRGQMDHWKREGPDGTLWIQPYVPSSNAEARSGNALDFGWAAVCASEVGDTDTLERLLAYADRFLTPTWEDGAYYYRRRDEPMLDGRPAAMDPHTGNCLLGYARLNVPGGLRKLYAGPLGADWFSRPAIVDISGRPDIRAARHDPDTDELRVVLRPGRGGREQVGLAVSNVWGKGRSWRLAADGETVARGDGDGVTDAGGRISVQREASNLAISLPLDGEVELRLAMQP